MCKGVVQSPYHDYVQDTLLKSHVAFDAVSSILLQLSSLIVLSALQCHKFTLLVFEGLNAQFRVYTLSLKTTNLVDN